MPTVNYVMHGCSSSRATPGVIIIQRLHTGEETLQSLLKTGWQMAFKRQIKIRTLYSFRWFILTGIFLDNAEKLIMPINI